MIYLVNSVSNRLIDIELKKIIKSSNVINFNLNVNSLNDVINEAMFISFDNEIKYIVIKNGNIFSSKKKSEEDEKLFVDIFNKIPDNVTMIFIENSIDSRKKTVKLIKDSNNLINLTVDYKNVYTLTNDYVTNNSFNADYSLTKYLVSLYGLNIDLIFNELDKLFLYFEGSNTFDYNKSVNIISKPVDDNEFHFVDALINKKVEDIYSKLNDLKITKTDPLKLFILIARSFRLIYYVKKYTSKNMNKYDIMKKLSLQEWQLDKIFKESMNYNEREVLEYINKIADIDLSIKTGKIDKNAALQLFIVDIIT